MGFRLGIDVGGTFTDAVLVDDHGQPQVFKVSSDRDAPERALVEIIELIASTRGISVAELMAECDLIVHGTTAVTNALIQTRGARTALLCTRGFRDSQEIRLGYKERRYDFSYPMAPMLVPRRLRLPVRERVSKDGVIIVPLDESDVRRHAATLRTADIEAVAVSFLWSFLAPAHERRAGEILRSELPDVYVTLSCDVLPLIREYDRTSTTVLNAFVGPSLVGYLERVEDTLRSRGFRGQLRFMQANAGLASAEVLARRPIYALNSGPAAAPTASVFFSSAHGCNHVLTVDMGGTSTDICLVRDGVPDVVKNIDVCRHRIGVPMININTIGAGGGSIAWVDGGKILRVGPQSAEADPGPACYGRGGTLPTVTDANVVLGYLSPDALLAGQMPIDASAAEGAIDEHIATPLGIPVEEAARGIVEVVNHNMVSGIGEVSVERGHDPRDFTLVAGGGAGGMHACYLAGELGIPLVIIPRIASTLCAFGQIVADVRHDYASSYAVRLRQADLGRIHRLYSEMEQQGRRELVAEGVAAAQTSFIRTMELRYVRQLHECEVTLPERDVAATDLDEIEERFHLRHEELYAYSERGTGICELINLGVVARGELPCVQLAASTESLEGPEQALVSSRRAFFPGHGFLDTSVYDGARLQRGNRLDAPALIEEQTTTVVLPPGWTLKLDATDSYLISSAEPGGTATPTGVMSSPVAAS